MTEATHETHLMNPWQGTLPEADLHVSSKPDLTTKVAVTNNSWLPLALSEVNQKTPMVYQIMNRLADLLPAEGLTHGYKASTDLLLQAHEMMNPSSELDYQRCAEANLMA